MMQNHNVFPMRFKNLDIVGAFISGLCAIHCAALPLLMALLPAIGMGFLLNESLEKTILVLSILLALFSLIRGFTSHQKKSILILWCIASLSIIAKWFIAFEALAIAGAIGLACCHLLNYRLLHSAPSFCLQEKPEDS